MHLGNGVICPVTGIPMLLIAGGSLFYAIKQARREIKKDKIAKIVLLTVFVFALQMINFSIPSTGSSGHIIGAILLASILGPNIAFIAMSLIIAIQALFFNDGGLLALGCNIFNMGFLACYVVYPFIYKFFLQKNRLYIGAILSGIVALQLGSIAVVLECFLSGSIISNTGLFLGLMQGIHLPIGVFEGIFTCLIILVSNKMNFSKYFNRYIVLFSFILGGFIVNYSSNKPDGLEWSMLKISDSFVELTQGYIYNFVQQIQIKISSITSLMTDFSNIFGLLLTGFIMIIICKMLILKKA